MKHQLSNDMSETDKAIVKMMAYSKVRQISDNSAFEDICKDMDIQYIKGGAKYGNA